MAHHTSTPHSHTHTRVPRRYVGVCACVRVHLCPRVCVCARVRVCVCARVRVRVRVCGGAEQKGGKVVYFGSVEDRAKPLVRYLEAIPDAPKLPSHTNPADWMLHVRAVCLHMFVLGMAHSRAQDTCVRTLLNPHMLVLARLLGVPGRGWCPLCDACDTRPHRR